MANLCELAPPITHHDLMLATTAKTPPRAKGWIYELKQDGFRCLISKSRKLVRLESRNGNNMASHFPELVTEIEAIPHNFVAGTRCP